jgi:hypothetical protein
MIKDRCRLDVEKKWDVFGSINVFSPKNPSSGSAL